MSSTPEDLGTAAHAVLKTCLDQIGWGIPSRASDYVGQTVECKDEEHAFLSPSGAKVWMACPAAPHMWRDFPAPEPAEPTRAVVFTEEYAAAVQTALDYVAKRVAELELQYPDYSVIVSTERRVDPGESRCKGTLDICIEVVDIKVTDGLAVYFVEIVEFKAGAATIVEPDDPQPALYLLGLSNEIESMRGPARLTVVQPRSFASREKIRSKLIAHPVGEYIDNVRTAMRSAVELIDKRPDHFNPSAEVCALCSARGSCKAAMNHALSRAGVIPASEKSLPETRSEVYSTLEETAARDTRSLSGAQIAGLLDAKDVLIGLLKAVEAYARDLVWRGVAPAEITAAYKLGRGRSSRKWKEDEQETFRRLKRIKVEDPDSGKTRGLGKKDLYQTALKSAPQVERLLQAFSIPASDARWDAFRALIEAPEGSLTLVPRSDPRPEVPSLRTDPDEAFAEEEKPTGET